MSKKLKRCVVCGRRYRPDPRTARTQKACPRRSCRAECVRRKNASWLKRHPLYGKSRRLKIRAWAKAYPDYWRFYRAAHLEYRIREMRRMSTKRREARRVAKQTAISRRLDGVVEYLLWREAVAKQTAMAPGPRAGDTKEDENRSRKQRQLGKNPRASRRRLPKELPP